MTELSNQASEPTPAPTELDAPTAADLRGRQNLPLAIVAGLAAAVVGAGAWAAFSYATGYELGLVVIAIAAVIGVIVRKVGQGVDPIFGFVGAGCSAIAWALGTVLSDVAFLSQSAGRPFLDVLNALGLSEIASLAFANLDVMDFFFLAIAVWEGWKFSQLHPRR